MATLKKLISPNVFAGAANSWDSTPTAYDSPNPAPDDAFAPPTNARSGVSLSPAFNSNTSGQPDVVRDIYQPQLRDINSRLQEAYNPPQLGVGGTLRHIAGSLFARRNPQLGAMISGDYGRLQNINALTKQYGLTEDAINQARTQQAQDITNRLHNAQADYFEQKPEIAMAPKPTSEEQDVTDLMKQVNPNTGKPFTHYEASIKRAQDLQDTKPNPNTPDLSTHTVVIGNRVKQYNPKTHAFDIDLGPSPKSEGSPTQNSKPVRAFDKNGKPHIVPRAQAEAEGMTDVMDASDKDVNDAQTHRVVLNDMQSKLNDVVSSADALDQNSAQRAIISKVLSHAEPGMWNDLVKSTMLQGASDKTKNYIQSVLSLKESALGLPKEITGGSRVSEIQSNALFQTLPSGASVDSKYALDQAKKFQANIDRLKGRVPAVRGMEEIAPHPSLSGNAGKDFGDAGGKPEGTTGTLSDGTKVVVKKGRIVSQ